MKKIAAALWILALWFPLGSQDLPVPAPDLELGALYRKESPSVEFRIWAPTAKGVTVSLFDKPLAPFTQALATLNLTADPATGVWSAVYSDRDPLGFYYEYRLETDTGIKRVLDPYARSMEGFKGTGFVRAAVVDMSATEPEGGWQGAEDVTLKARTDAVIYEVSIRDFTVSPDSEVPPGERGTYQGFIKKIPYLKSLGITHVQLMPVLNFMYNDETKRDYDASDKTVGTNYNWGYGPQNYFTPEGWFASDPWDPASRIRELKTLVRELHKAGIGVLLDVVYNHFGSPGLLDSILPNYYFRKNAAGNNSNDSFTGNDLNTSAPMVRKMIVDSLVWWTREYRVDGFRFDLMGLMDAETVLQGLEKTKALPGKGDILFLGEGWKTYRQRPLPGGMMDQNYMTRTDAVAVFNDSLRNLMKGDANNPGPGFLTGRSTNVPQLFGNLTGRLSTRSGDPYTSDNPGDNIQHLEVHDGMRLRDALSWVLHRGEASPGREEEIARRVNLGHLLLLTAQGIPLLHQGQESLASKPNPTGSPSQSHGPFVHNSYQAADSINRVPWTLSPVQTGVREYTAGLLALRASQPVFRLGTQEEVDKVAVLISQTRQDVLSYSLTAPEGRWFILANPTGEKVTFSLPGSLKNLRIHADAARASPRPLNSPQGVTPMPGGVELEGLTGAVIFLPRE